MIRIDAIAIEDFRGIRRLKLELAGKSFGVCGSNGTGKSGVVDAIEFALTGGITRLAGTGTTGISVKAHAPHVDIRTKPGTSRVLLTATIVASNKSFTIERRVASPASPVMKPEDPDVLTVVSELARHPEFALSRRDILKYVLTPAGERSKEVQALLRLDDVERVRRSLQSIANACKADVKKFQADLERARVELRRSLQVEEIRSETILAAVNERRTLLQLDSLPELQRDTSLKEGLATAGPKPQPQPRIRKAQA